MTIIVVRCYNQRIEYVIIVWKRHLHLHKEGMLPPHHVSMQYLLTKYRNLYLPGRVSRIIVSALFLSSSLMITIDRWSRMVGYKNPLASSKTSWTQITGGEILSEILTPGNFGSGFISLCHHLLSEVFVVDWWPLIKLVYVPDVCWEEWI